MLSVTTLTICVNVSGLLIPLITMFFNNSAFPKLYSILSYTPGSSGSECMPLCFLVSEIFSKSIIKYPVAIILILLNLFY